MTSPGLPFDLGEIGFDGVHGVLPMLVRPLISMGRERRPGKGGGKGGGRGEA